MHPTGRSDGVPDVRTKAAKQTRSLPLVGSHQNLKNNPMQSSCQVPAPEIYDFTKPILIGFSDHQVAE
jgi:hypothetical protein